MLIIMKLPIRNMITILPVDWIDGEYKYLVDFILSDSYLFIILRNENSDKYIVKYSLRDSLNVFYPLNDTMSTSVMRVYIIIIILNSFKVLQMEQFFIISHSMIIQL